MQFIIENHKIYAQNEAGERLPRIGRKYGFD